MSSFGRSQPTQPRTLPNNNHWGTQWLVTCRSYSPSGKLKKAWGPALTASDATCPTAAAPVAITDVTYDDLDRPTRTVQYLTSAEGGNRTSDTVYNLDGSVNNVKRGVGSVVAQTYAAYSYTNNGLVATVTDAKSNRTAHTYDGHDRQVKTAFPQATAVNAASATDYEGYGLDANGNLTSLRNRNGQTITLAYDNLNRLVSRSYPTAADNVSYGYDLLGRRLSATRSNTADNVAYAYDNASRLTSTTANGKTIAYQVDAAGNRTRTTWPDSTAPAFYTTTAYDALNRPTAIKELGTTNLASYAYDDLSRRSTVTLGNGTSSTTAYNNQGALASLKHDLSGTAQDQTYGYTRNQAGEITTHSWSNDAYQWAGVPGNAINGSKTYTANGLNQYTAVTGGTATTPSYDALGNFKGDGTWTYAYDQDNRLTTASKTGTSAALNYDAEGRLRQTAITESGTASTTQLLYDGVDLVAEYDATGTLQRRYVHGPGTDEPLVVYEGATTTNKSWLYADHLGSIVGMANAAGASTAVYSYGPYGEPGNTSGGQRFRYTGQQQIKELGLYYYKARFYSPTLGRFLQTDPIGTADDLNLYAYVGNNPLNFSDPSGLMAREAQILGGKLADSVQKWWSEGTARLMEGPSKYDFETGINAIPDLGPTVKAIGFGVGAIKGIGSAEKAVQGAVYITDSLPIVKKAVNSNLPHAIDRAVERGIYPNAEAAGNALRALSESMGKKRPACECDPRYCACGSRFGADR